MHTTILIALLTLAPLIAHTGGSGRCTTREDPALQRYRTDITKAPKGDKPPHGWPTPGKAAR